MKTTAIWKKYRTKNGTYDVQWAYDDAMKRFSIKRYSWDVHTQLGKVCPTSKHVAQYLLDEAMADAKAEWLATRPPWYERWIDTVQHICFAAVFIPVMLIALMTDGGIGADQN